MGAAEGRLRLGQVVAFNAAFWVALTLFHNAEAAIGGMRLDGPAFALRLTTGTLGTLLSTALVLVALRSAGPGPRLRRVLVTAALLALAFSAADFVLWFRILGERQPLSMPVLLTLQWSFRLSELLACYGLCASLFYARALRDRETRLLELRAQAQEAKLAALRYQVNPHLLFNALNALSALVVTGQRRAASDMIDRLARFYRSALAPDPALKVTLAQEMELQSHYLEIERTRFPGRVQMRTDVEPGLEQALVPHLLLQPLVENAVRHGVARTYEPVDIELSARRAGGRLVIRVENGGANGAARESRGAGIGLANVGERLRACYGEEGRIVTATPEPGRFRVVLTLPLELSA